MRRLCHRFLSIAAALLLCFTGCSEDPGLQERVDRLQAELQEKNRQLQDAQEALEKVQSELKSTKAKLSRLAPKESPSPTPASE